MSITQVFDSPAQVKDALSRQKYIASDEIGTTVFLTDQLSKPLLLEGPAGVGKTELAKSIAAATGRELIRLQCYEGLDETKALYEWEYAKQLLYTQLLRDKLQETLAEASTLAAAADRLAGEEDVFFSMRFLLQAVHRPLVFLTSNNTRELSEALKRRCLYLFIGYPAVDQELAVVRLKIPELAPKLAQQAVELVHRLRTLDLRKSPSISETLDWAKSLVALNAKQLDRTTLDNTLSVLLKHESDLQKVRRRIQVNERGAQLDDDDVRPSQRWRN